VFFGFKNQITTILIDANAQIFCSVYFRFISQVLYIFGIMLEIFHRFPQSLLLLCATAVLKPQTTNSCSLKPPENLCSLYVASEIALTTSGRGLRKIWKYSPSIR
jgi:hypothetical protein